MTSTRFTDEVLKSMVKIIKSEILKEKVRLMIHMDNACSHTAEYIKAYIAKSPFTQIKYPTYYPDLVSSDFFLFGALKRKIKCNYAKSSEELQELVERALNSFNPFDL